MQRLDRSKDLQFELVATLGCTFARVKPRTFFTAGMFGIAFGEPTCVLSYKHRPLQPTKFLGEWTHCFVLYYGNARALLPCTHTNSDAFASHSFFPSNFNLHTIRIARMIYWHPYASCDLLCMACKRKDERIYSQY